MLFASTILATSHPTRHGGAVIARHRPRAPTRAWLALLLALALAVRALVPSGWMPAGENRGMQLVPCPSEGAVPMAGHHHHHRDDHAAADHPCAFAGLGLPSDLPPPPPAILPRPRLAAITPAPVHDRRPGRGLAAPPPPATGPPLLA
jgi:hypothetical protein